MKYLFKAIWKKYFVILLSAIVITSFGFALLIGPFSGLESVEASAYKYVSDYGYPDVRITTELSDNGVIAGLLNENGVKNVRTRITFSSVIKANGKILSVKASSYSDISEFYVVREDAGVKNGLLVEKKFADNNGLKVGDEVQVKITDTYHTFTVGKIVACPESIVSSPIAAMWAATKDFGTVYFDESMLAAVTEEKKAAAYDEIAKSEKTLGEKENEANEAYNDFSVEADVMGLYLLQSALTTASASEKVNDFADAYDGLSRNAKDHLSAAFFKEDAGFGNKAKTFVAAACDLATRFNIDGIFDQTSAENQLLTQLVSTADNAKVALYDDYRYFTDQETVALVDSIRGGEANRNGAAYIALKEKLTSCGVYGEVTDDNIVDTYDSATAAAGEIKEFFDGLSFDSFAAVYSALADHAPDLEAFYGGIRERFPEEVANIQKTFDNEVIAADIADAFADFSSSGSIKSIPQIFFEIVSSTNSQLSGVLSDKKEQARAAYDDAMAEIAGYKEQLAAAKEEVAAMKGYENLFNEVLIVTDDGADNDEILTLVKDKYLSDIKVYDGVTFENSAVEHYIKVNVQGMQSLVYIVPSVFYVIVLIVVFLLITLIVKRARREIGTLRLLGFSTGRIRTFFALNGLIMTVVGIVVGFGVGYALAVYVCKYYANYLNLPDVTMTMDTLVFAVGVAASVLTVQASTAIATLRFSGITPIEVISNDLGTDTAPSKLVQKVTARLKPIVKFNLITLLRGKGKLVLSLVCMAAAVMVVFTSLAYSAAKDKVFDDYFNKRINYDAQVFVSGDADEVAKNLKSLGYVQAPSVVRYYQVTLEGDGKTVDTVFSYIDNADYIRIYDRGEHIIDYPKTGVAMEKHIADRLGLKLYDNVVIGRLSFEITAISFQPAGRVNYLSAEAAEKLSADYGAVVFDIDEEYHDELIDYVSGVDGYVYTMFTNEAKTFNKAIFDTLTMPSVIMIAFAVVVGFLIIVNINAYELIDQKRKLCIFKSLGFSFFEISKNKFTQSLVQWLVAVVIGVPLGALVSVIVLKYIGSSSREYVYASGIVEVLITLALTFAYTLLSHVVCMHDFKNTDITKEIKDKD